MVISHLGRDNQGGVLSVRCALTLRQGPRPQEKILLGFEKQQFLINNSGSPRAEVQKNNGMVQLRR